MEADRGYQPEQLAGFLGGRGLRLAPLFHFLMGLWIFLHKPLEGFVELFVFFGVRHVSLV